MRHGGDKDKVWKSHMYLPDRNQSLQGTGENRMKRNTRNFVKTLRQDIYLRKETKVEIGEALSVERPGPFPPTLSSPLPSTA